jgi:hypothetical protein
MDNGKDKDDLLKKYAHIPDIGGSKNVLPEGHPFEPTEAVLHAVLVNFRDAFEGQRCVSAELLSQGITQLQSAEIGCIALYAGNVGSQDIEPKKAIMKLARMFSESYTRNLMAQVKDYCKDHGIE